MLPEFKAIPGFVEAKRFVCGECGDIKLVVSLKDADFGGWAGKDFAPGAQLLEKWGAIEGLSAIETQNYTIAAM